MVIIKKDPGNPGIECLSIIHLFEADYILILKQLWGRQLVYQGEDNKCFGNQQHGLHTKHQAINAVHKKTLLYNVSHIMKTALLMFNNDATGCFDRIIISLATIAALHYNTTHRLVAFTLLPKGFLSPTFILLDFLQQCIMTYKTCKYVVS
jgi:hypothetical protein